MPNLFSAFLDEACLYVLSYPASVESDLRRISYILSQLKKVHNYSHTKEYVFHFVILLYFVSLRDVC